MKKVLLMLLLLIFLLTGVSFAEGMKGKFGMGFQKTDSNTLFVGRYFVKDNIAFEFAGSANERETGDKSHKSENLEIRVSGMYLRDVSEKAKLEIGVTVAKDLTRSYAADREYDDYQTDYELFTGIQYMVAEDLSLDFRVTVLDHDITKYKNRAKGTETEIDETDLLTPVSIGLCFYF